MQQRGLRSAGRRVLIILLVLILTTGVCQAGTTGNQAEDLISVALGQLGYTEGPSGYSKYGAWYGLPHSSWCAMFVSWSARSAGISKQTIPQFCSCTAGMNWYSQRGLWKESQWRGGSYVPIRGDLILFNWSQGSYCNHVGIVLEVKDDYIYTIEGNSLNFSVDEEKEETETPEKDPLPEPPRRVVVKRHPITSNNIRGYATPAYAGRTIPVSHPVGFVDLVDYASQRGKIDAVAAAQVLPSFTASLFGELHRATRGDFISALYKLFYIPAAKSDTLPFEDVLPDHPLYETVLAARSAGILQGGSANLSLLDEPLTTEAASVFLQRTADYLEGQMPAVDIGAGPFVVRGQLASTLYDLMTSIPIASPATLSVLLGGAPQTLAAYQVDGNKFASLESIRQMLARTDVLLVDNWAEGTLQLQCSTPLQPDPENPDGALSTEEPTESEELETPSDTVEPTASKAPKSLSETATSKTPETPSATPEPTTSEAPETSDKPQKLTSANPTEPPNTPVPEPTVPTEPVNMGEPRRVLTKTIQVRYGEITATIPAITVGKETYYRLDQIATLLGLDLAL